MNNSFEIISLEELLDFVYDQMEEKRKLEILELCAEYPLYFEKLEQLFVWVLAFNWERITLETWIQEDRDSFWAKLEVQKEAANSTPVKRLGRTRKNFIYGAIAACVLLMLAIFLIFSNNSLPEQLYTQILDEHPDFLSEEIENSGLVPVPGLELLDSSFQAFLAKNDQAAERGFLKYLELYPNWTPETSFYLALAQARQGKTSLAIRRLEDLLKEENMSQDVLLGYISLFYAKEGKYEQARNYLFEIKVPADFPRFKELKAFLDEQSSP